MTESWAPQRWTPPQPDKVPGHQHPTADGGVERYLLQHPDERPASLHQAAGCLHLATANVMRQARHAQLTRQLLGKWLRE